MEYIFDKCAFNVSSVQKVEDLYEWNIENGLLFTILNNIVNGKSCLIHGERRSGKTSILNCIEEELLNNFTKTQNVPVPVNIDFQSLAFKPMEQNEGFKKILYFISKAFRKARSKGCNWIPDPLNLPSINGDFLEFNDNSIINNRTSNDVLEDLCEFLKNKKHSAVLIFDEYENLQKVFYENPETFFYPFRHFQDNYDHDIGGFCFIIAGAERPAERPLACAQYGSPQFNLFKEPISVPPLSFTYFSRMWTDLYNKSSEKIQKKIDSFGYTVEEIYEMCGGRPGFAKRLAVDWTLGEKNTFPLRDWFENIFGRQPDGAKQILLCLAKDMPIDPFDSYTERLKLLYLIEENPDREIGGFILKGTLWADYLKEISKRTSVEKRLEPRLFKNAGELAKAIIDEKLLHKLLELRLGVGEKSNWLEFKCSLIPSQTQISLDEEQCSSDRKKIKLTKDDYIWHTLKAIIAKKNTRGGLICIGISDNGEIIGVDNKNLNEDDFIRNKILNHLEKTKFNLSNNTQVILKNYNLNQLLNINDIDIRLNKISDRIIVSITVMPIKNNSIDDAIAIEENYSGKIREFLLVRNKHSSNKELITRSDQKDFFSSSQPCIDLNQFWLELIR